MVNHSDVHTFIYVEFASCVSALDLRDVTVLPEGVSTLKFQKHSDSVI